MVTFVPFLRDSLYTFIVKSCGTIKKLIILANEHNHTNLNTK